MTDNVTQFPTPPKLSDIVFICKCGCSTFRVQADGDIECAGCLNVTGDHVNGISPTPSEWVTRLPKPPENPDRTEAGAFVTADFGSVDFSKARVVNEINRWVKADTLTVIVAYNTDGSGRHWFGPRDAAEKKDIVEQLTAALDYMKSTVVPE